MYTIKAPNVEFTLPADWSEVSLRQYLTLYDTLELTDKDPFNYQVRDVLRCLASDPDALDHLGDVERAELMSRLAFVLEPVDFSLLPGTINLNGVKLPQKNFVGTLLQKWTIDDAIRNLEKDGKPANFISVSVQTLCVYLYPVLTGKPLTEADQVGDVLEEVEALPVTSALPLSAYYLKRLTEPVPADYKSQITLTLTDPKRPNEPQTQRPNTRWNRLRRWIPFVKN